MSETALQSVPVLDVAATLELARCACGGGPEHFHAPIGHYYVCRNMSCYRGGSGVHREKEDAIRAWNRKQEGAGK
jgi:hypothetical protein